MCRMCCGFLSLDVPALYKTMIADSAYCDRRQYLAVLAGFGVASAQASEAEVSSSVLDPMVEQLQRLLSDPSVNVIPYVGDSLWQATAPLLTVLVVFGGFVWFG